MQKSYKNLFFFSIILLSLLVFSLSFSVAADSGKVTIVNKGLFKVCGFEAGCVSLAIPQNGLDKVNNQIKNGKFNQDVSTDPNFVKSLIQTPGFEATTQFSLLGPNTHGIYGYVTGDLQTVLLPPEKRDLSIVYTAIAPADAATADSPIPKELLPEAGKVYDFFSKGFEPGIPFLGGGSPMGKGSVMKFEVNDDGTKRIALYPDEKALAAGKPYSSYDFSDPKYDKIFDSVASLYLDPKGAAGGQVAALIKGAQKDQTLATYNPKDKIPETQIASNNPPKEIPTEKPTNPPEITPKQTPPVVNPSPNPTEQPKTYTPEEIAKAKQDALNQLSKDTPDKNPKDTLLNGKVTYGYGR